MKKKCTVITYRFFTPLNRRRSQLAVKRASRGITLDEARELAMLTVVIDAMLDYAAPLPPPLSSEELAQRLSKAKP